MSDSQAKIAAEYAAQPNYSAAVERGWAEMEQALRAEVHECRHRRHMERITLSEGRRLPDGEDTYWFSKHRARVLPYTPGSSVELAFTGEQGTTWADIMSQDLESITLRLRGRQDAETPPASIYWDPAWLLEALRRFLPYRIQSRIARILLGVTDVHPPEQRTLLLPHSTLDAAQRGAIEHAICTEVTRLWGPPGTGKTLVLAEMIDELRAHGESVLVVAPSHRAADLVAVQLLSRIRDGGALRIGSVVRWGTPQLPALRKLAAVKQQWGQSPEIAFHSGSDADAIKRAVHHADVVITTIHKTFISNGIGRLFDSVVIDEGAMVLLPAAVVAASYARRRAIIAGDHRQLPPVIHTTGPTASEWLRRSAFEITPSNDEARSSQIVTLATQYRMHPDICDVVSTLSYGGKVQSASSTTNRSAGDDPLGSGALYLIDTSEAVSGFEGRLANPTHARVVASLVDMIRSTPPRLSATAVPTIAVLARYRAQVAEIKRSLGKGRTDVFVDTVHGFQGSEADTTIVDLVASRRSFFGDYLTSTSASADGGRVLTVAISRARDRLVVVANVRYLLDRLHPDAMARRLVDMLLSRAEVIPAETVLATYSKALDQDGPSLRVG